MTRLGSALRDATAALSAQGAQCALVGGLAVSTHCEPRFTRDLDLAVSVASDREAEQLVTKLRGSGYRPLVAIEHEPTGRLATVRLASSAEPNGGVVVDLLFSSSGIEPEVVDAAELVEVLEEVRIPVARPGHLIALKLLARDDVRRPQDAADLAALLATADEAELDRAREAAHLIVDRGFARGRDLPGLLEGAVRSWRTRR